MRSIIGSSVGFALFIVGCSGESAPPVERGVDEDVVAKIASFGMDTEALEVDGNVVRVEGDMIFDRDELLSGAYDYLAAEDLPLAETESGIIPFGYRMSGTTKPVTKATDIKLVVQSIPNGWLLAADSAAATWSSGSNYKVSIARGNAGTGGTIKIISVDGASWPSGSACPASAVACISAWPSGGKPSPIIYVRSDLNPFGNAGGCEWNLNHLFATLIHEMGHAVGFTHPTAGGNHISGTATCSSPCNSVKPGYLTVMKSAIGCNVPDAEGDTRLSADDIASVHKVYP